MSRNFKICVEGNEKGVKIEVVGDTPHVLTGISTLVRSIHQEEPNVPESLIRKAVNVGLMSNEELEKEAKGKVKTLEKMLGSLKEALNEDEDEEDIEEKADDLNKSLDKLLKELKKLSEED